MPASSGSSASWTPKQVGVGIGAVLMLGVLLWILASAFSPRDAASQARRDANNTEPPAVEVTATYLYSAYAANTVAADRSYKDKTIIVSGIVGSVVKDALGNPYVALGDANRSTLVQCMFAADDESALASLRPGQPVRVHGSCDGQLVMYPILSKCRLLP